MMERALSMLDHRSLVLDAGCGDGRHLLQLEPSTRVVGLDLSAAALEISASRLRAHHLDHPLVRADVLSVPFGDESFDAVLCLGVLHHLLSPERQRAVDELRRVLRDGGLLCMSVHGAEDVRCGTGRRIERKTYLRGNGILTHYFTADEVCELLSGFKLVWMDERRHEVRLGSSTGIRHEIVVLAEA